MRWVVLAAVALSGCAFKPGGGSGSPSGEQNDAAPNGDGDPVTCAPGGTVCSGHTLETCNSAGDGFVAGAGVVCPLSCEEDDHCTAASNLPPEEQVTCDASAPALVPDAGATVTIVDDGGVRIDCSSCAGGLLSIPSSGVVEQGATDLTWFCLSAMDIPDGVEVTVGPEVVTALAFLVDGEAVVGGTWSAGGGAAGTSLFGAGGPGGGAGGPQSAVEGVEGSGSCAGAGGGRAGTTADHGAGGGGGGGHLGGGGAGGDGRNPSNNATGAGGGGGDSGCGGDALVPLVGGGGGGGGSDGSCGTCSWPGGGGGGAIQIASRLRIAIAGTLVASGGNGFGSVEGIAGRGGGGGGGAGGAILLEAPDVAIAGQLLVEGGDGGISGGGSGAPGARAAEMNGGNAADGNAAGEGGPGGGGGGGRIRLNTLVTVECPDIATPENSCSVSTLSVASGASQ